MSSQFAHASSKASGSTIEALVINRERLEFVADTEATWHDATVLEAITPRTDLRFIDCCVLSPRVCVEIKGTQGLRSNGSRQSPGSWLFQRRAHEQLVAAAGVYWFVVYAPRGSSTDVHAQVVVPATVMDTLLEDQWYEAPPSRSEGEIAQLSWLSLLDREVVLS
jgi:hypothetical protein